MKTHPSQRKFGLPVAIAASAHAILFLGFRSPYVHPTQKPPEPPVLGCTFPPLEEPVVDVTPERGMTEKSVRHGDPAPDAPELPPIVSDAGLIPIPVEQHTFRPTLGPIRALPVNPGEPGGVSTRLSNVGDLDFVPHALSRMSPIYPVSMKTAGISGTVTVMFTVDTLGRVSEVSIVNATRPEFEEPAMRAVSHWRFEPGKRHGRPTVFRMTLPLNFVLEN